MSNKKIKPTEKAAEMSIQMWETLEKKVDDVQTQASKIHQELMNEFLMQVNQKSDKSKVTVNRPSGKPESIYWNQVSGIEPISTITPPYLSMKQYVSIDADELKWLQSNQRAEDDDTTVLIVMDDLVNHFTFKELSVLTSRPVDILKDMVKGGRAN